MAWNHNVHYHRLVLNALPSSRERALDVGCGHGLLTRSLATCFRNVVAIDIDPGTLAAAKAEGAPPNVSFVLGNVMAYDLRDRFDFITVVATLHHLPLSRALQRFRNLLNPGGRCVAVGLYRADSLVDHAYSVAALPASWAMRAVRGFADVKAPIQPPRETLRYIRAAVAANLPGATLRRHLFWRYSVVWTSYDYGFASAQDDKSKSTFRSG
jgi:SAM-dependent methyltransferase